MKLQGDELIVMNYFDNTLGMDLKSSRGGTWLGVKDNGKIACLLNQFQPKKDFNTEAASRGFLVVNVLLGNMPALEYMESIKTSGVEYNDFYLIAMEPNNNNSYEITYYSSQEKTKQVLKSGFHGFGNCPLAKPFKKVVKGKENFQRIVEEHGKVETEEHLINELYAMMQDSKVNFPDQQLSQQGKGYPDWLIKDLSSVLVTSAGYGYGTRYEILFFFFFFSYSDKYV